MSLANAYSKMKQSGHSMSSDTCKMCKGCCNYAEGGPVLPGAADTQASMRRAFGTPKKMSEGGEIGVHKASLPEEPGKSRSHYRLHAAKRSAGPVKEENMEKAKSEHTRVLGEIVQMQKPKLKGLAHGGEVKGTDMDAKESKRFMDKGEFAVGKDEGGEMESMDMEVDSELEDMACDELFSAFKSGNKKEFMESLKALIMSIKE